MDTQSQIDQLRRDLADLNEEFYRGNFTSQQDFTKYANFTSALKVPVYTALPTKGDVGEIFVYNGKLYVCTTANNFVVVGTQS